MNLQKSSHPVHSREHFQHLPPIVVVQEHHLQLHKQQQQRKMKVYSLLAQMKWMIEQPHHFVLLEKVGSSVRD